MTSLLAACLPSLAAGATPGVTGGGTSAAQPIAHGTLRPGDDRHYELAAGQVHAHDVLLEAGHSLHAVVAPTGIDVAASLSTPDGREILVVDLSPDHLAAETIVVIAETEGPYRITVRPAVEGAPGGRYVIRLEAPRQATPGDTARVRVMRGFEAAVAFRKGPEPRSWEQAVQPLRDAIAGFRELGDREYEGRALLEAAFNANNLRSAEARAMSERALALYRELGDENGVTKAAGALGVFHSDRGETPDALHWLGESLALSRKVGNASQELVAVNNLGILYGRTSRSEEALDMFRRALALARTMQLPRARIRALINLGIATRDLGDYRLSLEYYQQAVALAQSPADSVLRATALNNLANLHGVLGDDSRALAIQGEMLILARQLGSAENEAHALGTLGSTYHRLGEYRKALEHHEQALVIARSMGDAFAEAAALDGIGMAWHRLGQSERGVESLRESLRIRRAVSQRHDEADTLLHLAQVERDRNQPAAALEHLEVAVALTDALRGQVVSPELRATFVAAEHERYELHVDCLMTLHRAQPRAGFDARALEASEGGRARVLLESLLEARTDIRQGIDAGLLERERELQRQLGSASTRLSRLLSRSPDAKDVAAARTSLEQLSDEHRALQARIRRESPAYAALTQPVPRTADALRREVLDADTILLEYALGDRRSWLWAVTPAEIASFELPARGEIERVAREAYERVTARQARVDEPAAQAARRVQAADAEWRRLGARLGHMLLGPAAAHLGDAWRGKRLLIVAPDILQYVPFAALPDPAAPGQPLVVDHEWISLPSASLLALIREQAPARPPHAGRLAVLADPVFEADDPRITAVDRRGSRPAPDEPAFTPTARALRGLKAMGDTQPPRLTRLPFSRQEARAISSLVPAGARLVATDFDASRAIVVGGALDGYDIVHFATHGLLNSERPELSGLVLSLVDRHGDVQDGFLRLGDVYNLELRADVVVLSACQTALGREVRGEGLIGLTRGFMHAGARRVVASLWQVDDSATAELMRSFYRGVLHDGLRPAAALRAAQRELARDPRWAAPFFWSGFVLQGDWR